MLLHARNLKDREYRVWHVPSCKLLKLVVWVDDVKCQWAEINANKAVPVYMVDGYLSEVVHNAKKITILQARKLVLIDPIDDPETEQTLVTVELEGIL